MRTTLKQTMHNKVTKGTGLNQLQQLVAEALACAKAKADARRKPVVQTPDLLAAAAAKAERKLAWLAAKSAKKVRRAGGEL